MELTLRKIANLLNGVIQGDESFTINSLSTLKDGNSGDLSFLANSKYRKDFDTTKCGAVLVDNSIKSENSKLNLIIVADPYTSFAIILELFERSGAASRMGREEHVFIDEDTDIGVDSYIGAFSYVISVEYEDTMVVNSITSLSITNCVKQIKINQNQSIL